MHSRMDLLQRGSMLALLTLIVIEMIPAPEDIIINDLRKIDLFLAR